MDKVDRIRQLREMYSPLGLAVRCQAMEEALKALTASERGACMFDPLNPCWDNRPSDVRGKHWGVGDACPTCNTRAALHETNGQRDPRKPHNNVPFSDAERIALSR